jgi:hypothetical protein
MPLKSYAEGFSKQFWKGVIVKKYYQISTKVLLADMAEFT